MLKKALQSSTENKCLRIDSKQCSVCKSCSTKTILYVCESDHVTQLCTHCQIDDDDSKESRKDHGDYSNQKQAQCKTKEAFHTLKQHKSDLLHKSPKDLASGDCDKRVKHETTKLKGISKSDHNIILLGDDNSKNKMKDNNAGTIETIVEYKNVNFKGDKSSDSGLSIPTLETDRVKNLVSKESLKCEACPRPVVCPVLDCGKTVAMNSAMLHFYYDHPKLPRILLTIGTPQYTVLKVTDIATKTQCLNILLIQGKECHGNIDRKVSSKHILRDNFTPLLLMSARMIKKELKSEFNKNHSMKYNVNGITTDSKSDNLEENEMILLWICKLEEPSIRYGITLMSKDRKYGHSYIGESVHIRKDQDALAVFQSADSMVIHGPAMNKILEDGQFYVILNIHK